VVCKLSIIASATFLTSDFYALKAHILANLKYFCRQLTEWAKNRPPLLKELKPSNDLSRIPDVRQSAPRFIARNLTGRRDLGLRGGDI
jgi:hypothetical protein